MKKIIKTYKGMQRNSHLIRGMRNRKGQWLEAEHTIDTNDNEIIITAAVKMELTDPRCKKLLEKMEQKQVSPVREVWGQIERENRQDVKYGENAAHDLYSIPYESIDKTKK